MLGGVCGYFLGVWVHHPHGTCFSFISCLMHFGSQFRIGIVYSTARKFDKAVEMFKKSMEIEENPGAYLNMAGIFAKQGIDFCTLLLF